MEANTKKRCIFCMEELEAGQGRCPACGKAPWEYNWKEKYLQPAEVLKDKYVIGAVLGNGSYGITYTAYDTVLKQRVAVKEFFPAAACRRKGKTVIPEVNEETVFDEGKARFKEEASMIFGKFDIPGICNVRDFFEENGTAYIVEEYLPGGTLKNRLRQTGRMDEKTCIRVFAPVMKGLVRIHAMGLLHMDISPDNLMFDGEGNLKLIDFGAAKQLSRGDGATALKMAYAPPEQYRDPDITGPWTDVYALCASMYQAVTGIKPDAALKRITKETLRPAADIANLSSGFSEILMQGLSMDVRKRYFSCTLLLEKLGITDDSAAAFTGQTRHLWGDRWLNVVTEQRGEFRKSAEGRSVKRIIRKIAAVTACVLMICAVTSAGLAVYIKSNPDKYFDYKLDHAMAEADRTEYEEISRDSRLYDKVMEVAIPSNFSKYSYVLEEKDVMDMKLSADPAGFFYLDYGTVKQIFENKLELDLTEVYSSNAGFNARLTIDSETGSIDIDARKTVAYNWDPADKSSYLELTYDPVSGRVMEVSLTADKEICKTFLKDVFPYIVPETYFEDQEIVRIVNSAADGTLEPVAGHPKFRLQGSNLFGMAGDNTCHLSVATPAYVY